MSPSVFPFVEVQYLSVSDALAICSSSIGLLALFATFAIGLRTARAPLKDVIENAVIPAGPTGLVILACLLKVWVNLGMAPAKEWLLVDQVIVFGFGVSFLCLSLPVVSASVYMAQIDLVRAAGGRT